MGSAPNCDDNNNGKNGKRWWCSHCGGNGKYKSLSLWTSLKSVLGSEVTALNSTKSLALGATKKITFPFEFFCQYGFKINQASKCIRLY